MSTEPEPPLDTPIEEPEARTALWNPSANLLRGDSASFSVYAIRGVWSSIAPGVSASWPGS